MRLVFSSHRLETAEGVAELLRSHDIDVTIRNGRGFKGNRRQMFSYRREAEELPEVWVLNNDDRARARQILFDAKLVESTRDTHSYLAESQRREDKQQRKRNRGLMIRLAALAVLALGAGIMFMNRTQTVANQPDVALQGTTDGKTALAIPPTLAVSALQQGIETGVMPALCLSMNGNAPGNKIMERLQGNGKRILPASHCILDHDPQYGSHTGTGDPAEFIDILNFRADSPTQGQIDINAYHHRQWAHYRTYRVELREGKWQIVKLIRHVAA